MEKLIVLCSLCNKTIDTTYDELMKHKERCWLCGHGDLNIIQGEYSELALDVYRISQALAKLPPADAARIAQPITDVLKLTKPPKRNTPTRYDNR